MLGEVVLPPKVQAMPFVGGVTRADAKRAALIERAKCQLHCVLSWAGREHQTGLLQGSQH